MKENTLAVNLDDVIKLAVTTAMSAVSKKREEKENERFDRRLRNTELLLKQYRALVIHRNDAVYSVQEASMILDKLDYYDDENEYCFKALKESNDRTAVVVAHINIMIDAFQYLADKKRLKPEFSLGCKIIKKMYIDDEILDFDEIMTSLAISQRTLYRRKAEAIQFLSGLIFGVDSLKFR